VATAVGRRELWDDALSIRELARHLNISIGTVSRALNGRSDVNAETRKRVLEAAAALGYSPNQSGRSLRQGTTGMIAAMIPSSLEMPLADTLFIAVLDGLRLFLGERGLDLAILLSGPDESAFAYLRRVVERRLADGILISDTLRLDPRISYLLERKIPFVAFGRSESPGDYPWVDLDFEGVAERAIERLTSLGHRRIALATRETAVNYGFVFADAYRAALRRRGMPVDPTIIFRVSGNAEGGYAVGDGILAAAERPTAVILVEEMMAVGLFRRLSEAGLVAGRDIAVIGLQERPSGKYLSPKLTCFRTSFRELGARLGEAMLATLSPRAGEQQLSPIQAIWPMELLVGESDGPPTF
jgi:DNA-binding LacI/PurR family transcriptional regulator